MRRRIFILLAAAGLLGLCLFTELFARPFAGLLVSVGIYAVGGGLLEVLVSPIIERDKYGAWSFHAELSVVRYVRKTRYWEFGAGYLRKDYPYREAMLPKEQFTAGWDTSFPLRVTAGTIFW